MKMKMKIKSKLVALLMIIFILCSTSSPIFATIKINRVKAEQEEIDQEITLIPIKKENIHDENISQIKQTFIRKAEVLVDNQEYLPKTPVKEIEKEQFDKIATDTWHPSNLGNDISCYIDLKAMYEISYIAYKDTFGNPTVIFSSGTPFHWEEIMSKEMKDYNTWTLVPIKNTQTRYIQLKTPKGTDAGISEIALYGKKIGEEEKESEKDLSNPNFGITMDKAVGSNAFIDDPLDILKVNGVIREYHNLRWTLDQKLYENKFAPSYGGKWNFDNYYKMLHDEGIIVAPCLQGTSKAITNLPNMTMNEKPIPNGADSLNPESYKEHASTMYQYAARYGANKVEDSKLLLADDQERVSGLGYLTYYENSNEPDKTWEGLNSYFSPYEMAAMCSSDYDGHEGTLGDTYGIKNADPNAKLVMGGLCSPESMPQYLDLMKLWFENNREDKKIAFDVINFHSYSGNKSPEETGFKQTCESITKWRNENARDKEVWLTEFGWDSNKNSPLSAPNNATQRDWLIRSYLLAEAAGVDRSTMYMIRDAGWEGSAGKYGTSGLTTEKGAWTKKPSWYGVYALKDTLAGYEFIRVVEETDSIYLYEFMNKQTNKLCYAIWSPTSNGTKIEDYKFSVGNKTKPTLTKLKDGYCDGEKTRLKIENGKVSFSVTESPVFLTLDMPQGKYEVPTVQRIDLTNGTIQVELQEIKDDKIEESLVTNFRSLFDEQANTPIAPKMNFKGEFSTGWGIANLGKNYPAIAILDLKEDYQISNIGLYDTTAIGMMKFYAGTPEKWEDEPFLECDLNFYKTWRNLDTVVNTRYIKIVKENNAELSEIAFYGYSIKEDKIDPNIELNTPKPIINKDKLKELVKQVEGYVQNAYTEESWTRMTQKFAEANMLLQKEEATQQEVDSIYAELKDRLNGLVKVEEKPEQPAPEKPKPTPPTPEEPKPAPPTPEEPKPEEPKPTPPTPEKPKPAPPIPEESEKPGNSTGINKPEIPKKDITIVDNTVSNKKIPQTGEKITILTIIGITILISMILGIRIVKIRKKQ